MHRAALSAFSLFLAGCSSTVPAIKPVSLKDVPQKPAATAPAVTADASLQPPVVVGGAEHDNKRLAIAIHNALVDLGYEVKPAGSWRVIGTIDGKQVSWAIVGPDGVTKGTVTQSSPSTAALIAIVPGVRSHLPRPSTPI